MIEGARSGSSSTNYTFSRNEEQVGEWKINSFIVHLFKQGDDFHYSTTNLKKNNERKIGTISDFHGLSSTELNDLLDRVHPLLKEDGTVDFIAPVKTWQWSATVEMKQHIQTMGESWSKAIKTSNLEVTPAPWAPRKWHSFDLNLICDPCSEGTIKLFALPDAPLWQFTAQDFTNQVIGRRYAEKSSKMDQITELSHLHATEIRDHIDTFEKHSLIDSSVVLTMNDWALTLMHGGQSRSGIQSYTSYTAWAGHAMIAIEGINEVGVQFIHYAHLVEQEGAKVKLETNKRFAIAGKTKTWRRSRSQVRSMLERIAFEIFAQQMGKPQVFFNIGGCDAVHIRPTQVVIAESFGLTKSSSNGSSPNRFEEFSRQIWGIFQDYFNTPRVEKDLTIHDIKPDLDNPKEFSMGKNRSIFVKLGPGRFGTKGIIFLYPDNCITWARKKLTLADIDLKESKYKSLFTITKLYTQAPPEEEIERDEDEKIKALWNRNDLLDKGYYFKNASWWDHFSATFVNRNFFDACGDVLNTPWKRSPWQFNEWKEQQRSEQARDWSDFWDKKKKPLDEEKKRLTNLAEQMIEALRGDRINSYFSRSEEQEREWKINNFIVHLFKQGDDFHYSTTNLRKNNERKIGTISDFHGLSSTELNDLLDRIHPIVKQDGTIDFIAPVKTWHWSATAKIQQYLQSKRSTWAEALINPSKGLFERDKSADFDPSTWEACDVNLMCDPTEEGTIRLFAHPDSPLWQLTDRASNVTKQVSGKKYSEESSKIDQLSQLSHLGVEEIINHIDGIEGKSQIDTEVIITMHRWAVTLIHGGQSRSGFQSIKSYTACAGHAMIAFEGINPLGIQFIHYAHLTDRNGGTVKLETNKKYAIGGKTKTWRRKRTQVERMVERVIFELFAQQIGKPQAFFNIGGSDALYAQQTEIASVKCFPSNSEEWVSSRAYDKTLCSKDEFEFHSFYQTPPIEKDSGASEKPKPGYPIKYSKGKNKSISIKIEKTGNRRPVPKHFSCRYIRGPEPNYSWLTRLLMETTLWEYEVNVTLSIAHDNCITWARKKLTLTDIDLKESKHKELITTPKEYTQASPDEIIERKDDEREKSITWHRNVLLDHGYYFQNATWWDYFSATFASKNFVGACSDVINTPWKRSPWSFNEWKEEKIEKGASDWSDHWDYMREKKSSDSEED